MRRFTIIVLAVAAVLSGLWVSRTADAARRRYGRSRATDRGRIVQYRGARRRRGAYVTVPNTYGSVRQARYVAARKSARAAHVRKQNQAAAARKAAKQRLDELPPSEIPVTHEGTGYHYVNGMYYRPEYSEGTVSYVSVTPPAGLVIDNIPADHGAITVGETTYYSAEGVYYTDTTQDGRHAYVVMSDLGADVSKAIADADPDPLEKLKEMSDFLGDVNSYMVKGIATVEGVLDSGQKVHLSEIKTINVRRPDKIYSEARGDLINRNSWYDGKTVSILDLERNVYGQVDVPPTIDKAFDFIASEYGVAFPLADLFYSDVYESVEPDIESAVYVGLHAVGSVDCHHIALSGEAVDAEIWIEDSDQPLIRKISLVHKELEDTPNFTATLDWDVSATFADEIFDFTAPEGAEQIEVTPVDREEAAE